MSDWLHFMAYSAVAGLMVFFSRLGIAKRVKNIELKIASIENDHQTAQIEMRNRMKQSRMEFRAEVDNALVPVSAKLDNMDSTLGELTTMVSSIVNKVSDESVNSKQP